MLRPRKALVLIMAVASGSAALASEYQPGEVIVKYKEGLRARPDMNLLYNAVGVEKVRRFSEFVPKYEQLILKETASVEAAILELQKHREVEYAQPNYLLYASPVIEEATIAAVHAFTPCVFPGFPWPPGCEDSGSANRPELKPAPGEVNPPVVDPDLSKTYGLTKVKAVDAWNVHKGSKDFIVADIDTGIDYNHVDLAFNIYRNPNPSDKKDIVGFDFVHNDGLPFDDNKHGTHTAGTIGAVGGNGIGISGVSQRVSLMALKFLTGEGSGTTADAIRAIDYAVEHGAKVLSNSWGGRGDPDNQVLHDAIDRAKAKDVLFVAAAGNESTDNDGPNASYPAAFDNDNIIAVAATDANDSMAYFSNYGKKTTHVAAPGDKVYSTVPGDKYAALSGTSMACPHVAGAAALVWSRHPNWTYKQVKDVLMRTVDQLPALAGKTVTGGRINVLSALNVTE